jgi:hypothetical protein
VAIDEPVRVESNLIVETLDRHGDTVERRAGHNIWLNLGRAYLASLLAYTSFGPVTPEENNRIRYMGFGIGGDRQSAPAAGAYPLGPSGAPPAVPNGYYPGTNAQNDMTPAVTMLERPVRISSTVPATPSTPPLYNTDPGEVWLAQVVAPATHPIPTSVKFECVVGENDISYGPFLSVPLSEVMLFTGAADPNLPHETGVAYDTFDPISKTLAFSLRVTWTVRF